MSGHHAVPTGGVWISDNGRLPKRNDRDLYITPRAVVEVAFRFLSKRTCEDFSFPNPRRILDLGAGEGIWGEMAHEFWPTAFIHGVEIYAGQKAHSAYNLWSQADMQTWNSSYACQPFDLAIGNPPYSLDEESVRIALNRVRQGGYVLMLLPLTFMTSQSRRDGLFRQYPLYAYAQYSQRISWSGDGKTPPRDHGLYLWKKGWDGPWRGYFLPNTLPCSENGNSAV